MPADRLLWLCLNRDVADARFSFPPHPPPNEGALHPLDESQVLSSPVSVKNSEDKPEQGFPGGAREALL